MFRESGLGLLLLATSLSEPVYAEPPEGFATRVEQLREAAGSPGISIAIVEGGRTTLARGWGVRKQGETGLVDAQTIFPIASSGKAVTVAALARLVDDGRLGWDDKVIDHMPWFRMHDPWVTNEITVRDLLVHRSGLGLGAGDLLFVPRSNLTRKETVERLRYIKPETSFRSAFAYDNLLYIVAGQLIEEITGQSWESFVEQEVLKSGGMLTATSSNDVRFSVENRAWPHARVDGAVRGDGPLSVLDERDELGRNAMPAGGVAMSANDLAQWIAIQLRYGAKPEGGRLFSEAVATEMWRPVTPIPIQAWPGELGPLTPNFSSYALGWFVEDYRGAKIVWHSGADFGFLAVVVLLPDQDVGFAIAMNSEEGGLRRGLMYELLDHYLGHPASDWPSKWASFAAARIEAGKEQAMRTVQEAAPVGPALPLMRYAGAYRDDWYGNVIVSQRDNGLWINFTSTPRMEGKLVHHQYETFKTVFTDRSIEPAFVTFQIDANGLVERVKMVAVSPIADFSFDYHDLDLIPFKEGK